MKTAIAGWGHSRFGRVDVHELESLVVAAVREAMASSVSLRGALEA